MYSKLYELGNSVVLACCEKELIGRTLEDGSYCVKINSSFYKDRLVSEAKLRELLKLANNINLFGAKPVNVAMKEGLIKESDIIRIKGIPHVNIFKI